eukprot:scaffold22559_cov111-Cylindrotheca_fusiformis.AAC.22
MRTDSQARLLEKETTTNQIAFWKYNLALISVSSQSNNNDHSPSKQHQPTTTDNCSMRTDFKAQTQTLRGNNSSNQYSKGESHRPLRKRNNNQSDCFLEIQFGANIHVFQSNNNDHSPNNQHQPTTTVR